MDSWNAYVWEDREIRLDQFPKQLECRPGEFVCDSIHSVEDTKGNNGEKGQLMITNLRLMWICHQRPSINVSIGYNTMLSLSVRVATSRVRGKTQALCINCKQGVSRFEFIFTSLVKVNPALFVTVQHVFRAYQGSKLYRDLRLRGAIVKDKELILLPQEKIFSRVTGVWNLSSDQGNIGSMFITNVRVVWHANMAENFNISVPYIQLKAVKTKESRFGMALVMETMARSGGYVLGFRIDPASKLDEVFREIESLHQVYSKKPIFGVEVQVESTPEPTLPTAITDAEAETVVKDDASTDALAAYLSALRKDKDREPVFDPELGLAVESLPEGLTIKQLWNVV